MPDEIDFWGNPVLPPRKHPLVRPTGYAAPPGTGPQGETCKTCAHACAFQTNKRWYKCALARHAWTGSVRTDIKVRSPACSHWQPIPS